MKLKLLITKTKSDSKHIIEYLYQFVQIKAEEIKHEYLTSEAHYPWELCSKKVSSLLQLKSQHQRTVAFLFEKTSRFNMASDHVTSYDVRS